jgi:hypothetical protein
MSVPGEIKGSCPLNNVRWLSRPEGRYPLTVETNEIDDTQT